MNSWDELKEKFQMYRDEMTESQEREFVNDCFDLYEKEGFAKVFWSSGSDFKQYFNKSFEVVERATENDCDLCVLPMWRIKFEDGETILAYPDEIIPSEMIANGCKMELNNK